MKTIEKIGKVGESVASSRIESISFFSKTNLLDYDLILISLNDLYAELSQYFSDAYGNESSMDKLDREIIRRKQDLNSFFKHGGTIILFLNADLNFLASKYYLYVESFGKGNLNALGILGLSHESFQFEELSGSMYEDLGSIKDLNDYFSLKYEFKAKKILGKPILKTKKGNDTVASITNIEKGLLYILPRYFRVPTLQNLADYNRFHSMLEKLINETQIAEIEDTLTPEWVSGFTINGEDNFLRIQEKLKTEEIALNSKITQNENKLKDYANLKRLIYSGDDTLEHLVKESFEKFGFNVHVPEGNKDDLVILEENFKAVLEIKGLKHSGSTKNSMQLEKWVTNYALENDLEAPKGVLIINAFKELPVNERIENPFPKDMLDFSVARNHCLMLTLDLMNIVVDFNSGLVSKNEIQNLLQNTTGVMAYTPKISNKL